jgi:plastocyanin
MMNRRRGFLIVAFAFALALAGCGGAGPSAAATTTTTTPATPSSPSAIPVLSPAATTGPSDAATPIPTLVSTTETASAAPAGAIPIRMTVTNGNPRFEPDRLTVRAGTVIFYLENGANVLGTFDHNMRIGPAIGQVVAGTPRIYGNSNVTFTVHDLAPGSYVYWCSIAGLNGLPHSTYGMVGTLTVAP